MGPTRAGGGWNLGLSSCEATRLPTNLYLQSNLLYFRKGNHLIKIRIDYKRKDHVMLVAIIYKVLSVASLKLAF